MIKFTINNYFENLDIHFQSVILGLLEIQNIIPINYSTNSIEIEVNPIISKLIDFQM